MKKTVVVNIYNFIRMSHVEPSRFILDDFETIRNQIITVKQYGFPGTYALKYDALMEPRYQELLKTWLDDNDEISAWWEITEPLCRRACVPFRGNKASEEYDDRVDSAYSVGYTPDERKRLVDAYMADFYHVFGKYPQSIGSWILDAVTMAYAWEHYQIQAAAICRDQMGVDGFTLWGGWPNGAYFPSRRNEFIPAQSVENQIPIPVFRLLGPDPIYNFEADVRDHLQGVYTLEPSWLIGRDPKWIHWFFSSLCEEDALGMGYAHVGQENNFLWENIRPGFAPQLAELKRLATEEKIRVETMANTAKWFGIQYKITPPVTFQASRDWDNARNLSAQWYASNRYRVGFLWEAGHLRIRDWFLFDEKYPSRYLECAMTSAGSTFDALPILFPQRWMGEMRPFIRLMDEFGNEPKGIARYYSVDAVTACAELSDGNKPIAVFNLTPSSLSLYSPYQLAFDILPVYTHVKENRIFMSHEGFSYDVRITKGEIQKSGRDGVVINPDHGEIQVTFGEALRLNDIFRGPFEWPEKKSFCPAPVIPPFAPEFFPGDSVFPWGDAGEVALTCRDPCEIHYTLDGTEPTLDSPLYTVPLLIRSDTEIIARSFLRDGGGSEVSKARYQFSLKDLSITSPTNLDRRPVFCGKGMNDLLSVRRGTLDYIDGSWRGTLENLDLLCTMPEAQKIKSISIGFLSHHRSGIVYPASVELYAGPDADHLTFQGVITIPDAPGSREIEKMDASFQVNRKIGAFRILSRRHERMPQWCAYRGTTVVFTMVDNLIVVPDE